LFNVIVNAKLIADITKAEAIFNTMFEIASGEGPSQ
jgi:hypothetical protein